MHEGNAHLSCRKEREGLSTFSAFITCCNKIPSLKYDSTRACLIGRATPLLLVAWVADSARALTGIGEDRGEDVAVASGDCCSALQ